MQAEEPETQSTAELIPNDRNLQSVELFPQFPNELLFSIFNVTDNIALVHLASLNSRYEPIAREVIEKRYVDKYFVIRGDSEQQREQYSAQISTFGDVIRAVEVKNIREIDEHHWLPQLLQKLTPNIRKFSFRKCSFKNADGLFARQTELTHLTFRGGRCETGHRIHLPEYHHLKALELTDFKFISKPSLDQILRNNQQMESLILRDCDTYYKLPEIMDLVHNHLNCLRELNLLDSYGFGNSPPSFSLMNAFSNSLEYLESFAMGTVRTETIDLLPLLSINCNRLKSFEFYLYSGDLTNEVIRKICTLNKLETFSLIGCSDQNQIESIIERLPHLRSLKFSRMIRRSNSEICSILRKCNSLEKLTFESEDDEGWRYEESQDDDDYNDGVNRDSKFNVQFHNEFVQTIRNPRTRIELTERGKMIGYITKEEIVWRNIILHWIDYNPAKSQSSLHLLDLANIPKDTKARHKQPLNLIFNYLDLNCLYAFSRVNKECKQLVHGYIFQRCKQLPKSRAKQRSIQRGKLLLTDEFGMNLGAIRMFGRCISNLDVTYKSGYAHASDMSENIEKYCKNLTILCFRTYTTRDDPHNFIVPQVRHYLYYGYENRKECRYECDLSEMARICPDLEILEFKTPMGFYSSSYKRNHSFRALNRIKFIPSDDSDVEFVLNFFKNTDTKVIVDH